ncbi:MAG TPA: helix-hairpin-helix domain-containing protein [Gammaproteobacteria bacterium]|nr:helix-hairpin-helix domain-containing protein [Gammaproteobacteria bacterium]
MRPEPGARFADEERAVLLAVKGVGPTVLARFEQRGIASLAALAESEVDALLRSISAQLGSSCWRNSPQARRAVAAAVTAARQATRGSRGPA